MSTKELTYARGRYNVFEQYGLLLFVSGNEECFQVMEGRQQMNIGQHRVMTRIVGSGIGIQYLTQHLDYISQAHIENYRSCDRLKPASNYYTNE